MDYRKSVKYIEQRKLALGLNSDYNYAKKTNEIKKKNFKRQRSSTTSLDNNNLTKQNLLSTPISRQTISATSTPATITPIQDKRYLLNDKSRPNESTFTSTTTATTHVYDRNKCCNFSLLYISYFTAIYAIIAYTSISILSIHELVKNSNSQMIPLYMLVIGYITVALMSFNLLVALYKDYISIILCWIVTLSVFILPEVALNIVLAETVLNWFDTLTGTYMTILLICRITINIPCLVFVLIYYLHKTKRENQLNRMLKPIKQNILNGEILKRYENVAIDEIKYDCNEFEKHTKVNIDNHESTTVVNEKLIQKAIDEFMAKIDTNDLENIYKFIPNDRQTPIEISSENQRILISERDKLKLIMLKKQFEKQQQQQSNPSNTLVSSVPPPPSTEKPSLVTTNQDNIFSPSNTNIVNNQLPLYTRFSEYQANDKINPVNPKINELNFDLKSNDQLEIDFDKTKNNFKSNQIEIDIEKPLNEIKIDYNKQTNEIKINLLNKKSQRKLNQHLIYLPPAPTLNEQISKFYDNTSMDMNESNVLARVSNLCDCVNISSCTQNDLNEKIIHDKNCSLNSFNKMTTFKPSQKKRIANVNTTPLNSLT